MSPNLKENDLQPKCKSNRSNEKWYKVKTNEFMSNAANDLIIVPPMIFNILLSSGHLERLLDRHNKKMCIEQCVCVCFLCQNHMLKEKKSQRGRGINTRKPVVNGNTTGFFFISSKTAKAQQH